MAQISDTRIAFVLSAETQNPFWLLDVSIAGSLGQLKVAGNEPVSDVQGKQMWQLCDGTFDVWTGILSTSTSTGPHAI